MKRSTFVPLLVLAAGFSTQAFADDWKFMPVLDAKYHPDITLSITDGALGGTPAGSGNYTGAELAFNCLALQPPTGIIRSKISYGQFNRNGLKLSSFEVNPRWTVNLNPALSVGVGPGIGLVKAEVAGQATTMAALQIGADLDYKIGALNLGLGARWQDTRNKPVTTGMRGANNTLIVAKVGINF